MYNLLAHPHTLARLYDELCEADLTSPIPEYAEIRELPYLDACVNEGARLHPPFALPFERVVPEGGVTVLGHYLPGGTVVGGNPYVVNRDKATFGPDVEFWRPERWLEKDEVHKRRLEQALLTVSRLLLKPLDKANRHFSMVPDAVSVWVELSASSRLRRSSLSSYYITM